MADNNMLEGFKVVIIIMMIYSVSITLLSYSLETIPIAQNEILPYSDISNDFTLNSINSEIEDSITRQTNIPVIELGALVFYSGNILIDLLLNFIYAVPQMFGLLLNGITTLFNMDTYIWATLQIFISVAWTAMYFIGLIQLLTGVRSGRII